ncbi:MAG: D-alanine--poly(phosphoribitol) ligase subunit 1 [Verrucomicrobiae bacterium]|nr:D-alanine--poly(phosphoribitol) ligase subunit 1 [Verrucomicrobiae bacterium]
MTVEQLIESLEQQGVQLWLEGDRVQYKAAAKVLTPAVIAALRERKPQIVEYLQKKAAGSEGPATLSFTQEALWFLDKLVPNSLAYVIPLAVRLSGSLNLAALQRSFGEIVRRHEVLRTVFEAPEGKPIARVLPAQEWSLPVVDLPGCPEAQWEAEIKRLVEEESRRPFDLTRDLMMRTKLFRLAPTEHVLTVMMHHIASDGWSVEVLLKELSALYEADCANRPAQLPELPLQYAGHVIRQRQRLRGPVMQQQLEYWRTALAGAPPRLDLPIDKPRPPVQTMNGWRVQEVFSPALLAGLQELSRREKASLFMTLLAAFQVLLHRYTQQEDILVGTPVACRNRPEVENLIGCFVNTAVIRGKLTGATTFREVLASAREATFGALANQEFPLELLVKELQPERDLAYAPLFQVMFVANNYEESLREMAGLKLTPVEAVAPAAPVDLTLYFEAIKDGLAIQLEFNTDLFEPASIGRMFGHYRTLLEGIVANPAQPIGELPLLPAAEKRQILVEWNDSYLKFRDEQTLADLFEEQAAKTPDAVAVVAGKRRLTYAELNAAANQLADYLRGLGVQPEVLVAICVKRSPQMIIAILAILKAGGAYVPVDPNYPRERMAFLLEDSQAKILLTQRELRDRLPALAAQVVELDGLDVTEQSRENLPATATATNLAYLIFTSGSTGRPKAVAVEHRNAVVMVAWARTVYAPADYAGLLFATSICFDLSVYELFFPLGSGGKVILAENALELHSLPAVKEVTLINTVPSVMAELLRVGPLPANVRIVNLAGEFLPQAMVEQLYGLGVSKVFDLYGPSEDTTYSTWTLRTPGGTPNIGRPISNTQAYVLDKRLQPVPVGVAGEIYLAGTGVCRGYLNRPELTAEKFLPNPFRPGGRMYRTGDLARYRPDGLLEYLGRVDRQVKIRGFRIEPDEVQATLRKHPQVHEAVVTVREDVPGDKRLVAYVVSNKGQEPTAAILREFVEQKLPAYMVPSAFVLLPALPLTPNGKLDHRALPAPQVMAADAAPAYVAPRDELEVQLAGVWAELFNRSPIGRDDNFFELGGHSLLAVRLMAHIEKLTGKNLPLVTLFQAPTIERLAAVLRQEGWTPPWQTLVAIKPGGSKPPFYCVHGVGGNILEYLDLAKYMDNDQPFYGIQAVGLDGKQRWLETVEEQAAHHIGEIRAFQPTGPYFLGGSSYGGLVAYEMAQQLHRAGQKVALLAFFDTGGPGYPEYLDTASCVQKWWDYQRYRFALHWGNFRAASGRQKWDYVREKTTRLVFRVGWYARRFRDRFKKRVAEINLPKVLAQTKKVGEAAADQYVVKPYPGKAVLFRATQQPPGIRPDPTLGWGPYVLGGIEFYDTPGHHGAIVRDPRAQKLAEQLMDALKKVHAEERKS